MSSESISEQKRPRQRRGGLFFPIVLIALGVVFLLNNFKLIQGNPWQVVFNLWPLILVAIGLDGLLDHGGLSGATILIGLGVVFLLSNFGYLAANVWELVLRLWPVILVAVGFDIVVGRRSLWLSLTGLAITLAILVISLWYMGVRLDRMQAVTTSQISQPLQDATQARVNIQQAAGGLELSALASGDRLVEGQVPASGGTKVTENLTLDGQTADYTIRQSGNTMFLPSTSDCCDWKLQLSPSVPLDLDVSMGAGQTTLDLGGLNLTRLKVDLGAGQSTITLPENGAFNVEINLAVGQVIVVVSRDAVVHIFTNTALSAVSAPADYRKGDHELSSPGYSPGSRAIEVKINNAVGSVTVQYP